MLMSVVQVHLSPPTFKKRALATGPAFFIPVFRNATRVHQGHRGSGSAGPRCRPPCGGGAEGDAGGTPNMAIKSTIFKASLQIADIDHSYYADHALTLAPTPARQTNA